MSAQATPPKPLWVLVVAPGALREGWVEHARSQGQVLEVYDTSEAAWGALQGGGLMPELILVDWDAKGEFTGFVLLQKLKLLEPLWNVNYVVISDALDGEDLFLMGELELQNCVSSQSSPEDFYQSVTKILDEKKRIKPVYGKIRQLELALRKSDLVKAAQITQDGDVVKELKENPQYCHLVAELYILKREYPKAASFLQDFLKKAEAARTETLKSLSTLGKALCLAGKYKEAHVVFERLAAKSPKNLSHKVSCGDALMGLDEVLRAEGVYDGVLQEDATHTGALVGKAKVSMVKGDMNRARKFFDKVQTPYESLSLASFFNNRGVSLVHTGRIEEAIQFYETALEFLERYKGYVQFNLGLAYYRMGRLPMAQEFFSQALSSQEGAYLAKKKVFGHMKRKGIVTSGQDEHISHEKKPKPKMVI